MTTALTLKVESTIKEMKAGILQVEAAICRLKSLEEDAAMTGLSDADIDDLRSSLDRIATRTQKLGDAERAFHEKVNQIAPSVSDGPVAMIGT